MLSGYGASPLGEVPLWTMYVERISGAGKTLPRARGRAETLCDGTSAKGNRGGPFPAFARLSEPGPNSGSGKRRSAVDRLATTESSCFHSFKAETESCLMRPSLGSFSKHPVDFHLCLQPVFQLRPWREPTTLSTEICCFRDQLVSLFSASLTPLTGVDDNFFSGACGFDAFAPAFSFRHKFPLLRVNQHSFACEQTT